MNAVSLLKRRRKTAQQAELEDIVRGSVVMMERVCGKPNCRCVKGHRHKSLYISQYREGSPRMIYIPKRSEADARRMIRNYQRIKALLHKISDANIRLIVLPGKRRQ
jgi:hypothetical protein